MLRRKEVVKGQSLISDVRAGQPDFYTMTSWSGTRVHGTRSAMWTTAQCSVKRASFVFVDLCVPLAFVRSGIENDVAPTPLSRGHDGFRLLAGRPTSVL